MIFQNFLYLMLRFSLHRWYQFSACLG